MRWQDVKKLLSEKAIIVAISIILISSLVLGASIGYTTIGSDSSLWSSENTVCVNMTSTETGIPYKISHYGRISDGGNVIFGIYDSAGTDLIAESKPYYMSSTIKWHEVEINTTAGNYSSIPIGEVYLCFLSDSAVWIYWDDIGNKETYTSAGTYPTLPSSISTNRYASRTHSTFINYTESSFFEDWEAGNFNNWDNVSWQIATDQAIDTNSAKCAPNDNCYMNLTADLDTSSSKVNVSFYYYDDDCDAGEAVWYWKNSSGEWINKGNIDGGTLYGDDGWFSHSEVTTDEQYQFNGFAIQFYGNPGVGENYWVDNINISTSELLDQTPPYFTDISNQTIDNITTLSYDLNASDETGFSCFDVNDTTNFKINCNGLLENNTQLTVQRYNINITINDTSNNINSSLIWVNVTEYIAPISDTSPRHFYLGSSKFKLSGGRFFLR